MQQLYLLHNQPEFLAQVVREMEKEGQQAPTGENLSQVVREMVSTVPWGDQYAERARACTTYGEALVRFGMFERIAPLSRGDFISIGSEFKLAAESLEQQVPRESDADDSNYSPSEDKDVDVNDLFRDL
jgi:hypothetical protein